jgi:hypothetical protein
MDDKDKFYYQGKYFSDYEDVLKYALEFNIRKTNEKDFKYLLDMLQKDIWANLCIYGQPTNLELRDILESGFQAMMREFMNIKGN